MTLADEYKIDDYIAPWTPSANAHKAALGDGWQIACEFIDLHLQALESTSVPGKKPTDQEQAVMAVGAHGFSLFTAGLKLIIRGEFDVALYLARPLSDIQAQLYAVSKQPALATDYLQDNLKASKARKLVIADLQAEGDLATAQWLKDRWSGEARAANKLAHPNTVHGDIMLQVGTSSVTPWLGGRTDPDECSLMVVGSLEYEHWLHSWYRAFYAPSLPGDWVSTLVDAGKRFGSWAKVTVGVPPPQPPNTTSLN